jgi:hypothetical protein
MVEAYVTIGGFSVGVPEGVPGVVPGLVPGTQKHRVSGVQSSLVCPLCDCDYSTWSNTVTGPNPTNKKKITSHPATQQSSHTLRTTHPLHSVQSTNHYVNFKVETLI